MGGFIARSLVDSNGSINPPLVNVAADNQYNKYRPTPDDKSSGGVPYCAPNDSIIFAHKEWGSIKVDSVLIIFCFVVFLLCLSLPVDMVNCDISYVAAARAAE